MSKEIIKDQIKDLRSGQHKRRCPACQDTRSTNKKDRPLSIRVTPRGVQYHCHHCGESGGWYTDNDWPNQTANPYQFKAYKEIIVPEKVEKNELAANYLRERGISDDVVDNHVLLGEWSFAGERKPAIGFPYRDNRGEIVSVKWRSANGTKQFSQQGVCEDFFNIENYKSGNDLLICEGEMDALSWMTAGVPEGITVVSIPNGAPPKVKDGKIDPADDRKFSYIYRSKSALDEAPRIILNTDNDGPGDALKTEILRRVGRAKMWTLSLDEHKDAAEALENGGTEYLSSSLELASPIPEVGLHNASVFDQQYVDLYENGQAKGASTGIASLDRLINIPTGMLTVVTGVPSSGKSDLVDQICMNLAKSMNWKTVYCSFEKPPELHMAQLAQKFIGRPFFDGPTLKMTTEERDFAFQWINEHFLFMDYRRDGPSEISKILEIAKDAVMRMGCRILVIDPYNYLDVGRNTKETDAISQMLTQVQLWAKEHDAHVFFIAHPTKISPDRRSANKVIVTGHDIAGSAAWFAKADIGLSTWRHPTDEEPPEAHVWKVRWSWLGRNGSVPLTFDKPTGRWSDYKFEDDFDWDF